ncbi:MAG: DUF4339 domain-containing protein, partial [Verrucomicrobiaceae bacterium]
MITIFRNGEQEGPYDEQTIRGGLQRGQFFPEDLGWREGMSEWEPLRVLIPSSAPAPAGAKQSVKSGVGKVGSAVHRFLSDEQDPATVKKVIEKVKTLLTTGEEIRYIGVQKKPLVTIAPDSIVLTSKRFMIVRPKLMGLTFQDFQWRQVANVHLSEQMLTATISCKVTDGRHVEIDSIPKEQARRIYTYAQEVEEMMHEERRQRGMEERRAGIGGIILQQPASNPAPPPAPVAVADDPVEVLGKLKRMLDAGLIEAGEFDLKK